MIKLIIFSFLIFLLNIPFGYWRARVKKFSFQWILAIHIPVLLIILLRIFSGLGFAWYTYIFTVLAFFIGQTLGAFLSEKFRKDFHKA